MVRKDKVMDSGTYSILLPSVRDAMSLCTKVSIMVGPLLGGLKGAGAEDGLQKFSGMLAKVDPVRLNELLMDAAKASHLSFNEKPISGEVQFEQHFSTKRGDLYLVLFWTLWECVRDFFPMLEGALRNGMATAAKVFQSQTDGASSTGSGDQSGTDAVAGASS